MWWEIIQFLGGTAAVLALVGFLTRSLIKALFDRDLKTLEIRMKSAADQKLEELKKGWLLEANRELERLRDKLQRERDQLGRGEAARSAREERLRGEILRWANPILGAVSGLRYRLHNILERDAYRALQRLRPADLPPNWSITYEYFMPSTLFLFAQYFHWVRRLQVELGFELFETQGDKDRFFEQLRGVSTALGGWPQANACIGFDCQVFTLQQRGIAEAVTVRAEGLRCMDYHEFMEAWEDPPLSERLAPLRALLEEVVPGESCRWKRLVAVSGALQSLEQHCREMLKAPDRAPVAATPAAPA
jgi:hypothetical protein